MTSPTFQIGDFVAVKENSCLQFRITWICQEEDGTINYSTEGIGWYPASSLQLVEPELKVGDYAEVILPNNSFTGKIGQVSDGDEKTVALYDMGVWSRGNLRKLTPEEIAQHTNPGKQYPITPAKDFDELTLRDVARMAGICKNEYGVWISTLLKRAHETEDRLSAIEKRLAVLEGERPDVCASPGGVPLRIIIVGKRGDVRICETPYSFDDCMDWCKRVLDSMKEA